MLEQDVRESDLKDKKDALAKTMLHSSSEAVGFIKRIRYHQLINQARLAVPPKVDDYVREERIPEAAPQKSILDILFPIYRPLNPVRLERKMLAAANPENCKLIIQVLRGFNLPSRIVDARYKDSVSNPEIDPVVNLNSLIVCSLLIISVKATRTFVEASFQRNRVRTAAKEGVSPQWNETLSLVVLTPNGDLSPKSLLDADVGMESVFLNLFDEKLINLADVSINCSI